MEKFKVLLQNPIYVFIVSFLLIGLLLVLVSPNFFEGEIIYRVGPHHTETIKAPLSLAYFIGLGYEQDDMKHVVDFYLTKRGYILAFCIWFGFPIVFAYRAYVEKRLKKN
jgi:hypothetical protein